MTSDSQSASQGALSQIQQLQSQYTQIGLPAMSKQLGAVNAGLAGGESPYIASAFQAQRTGLQDSIAGQERGAKQSQLEGSKKAMSGGNQFANLTPADIGSKLANALYGSKFEEGQADIGQKMNLMNMALGGAGTAGNAGMQAAGNQLGAIGMMPNYNSTYANITGAASALGSVYGAYQNWAAGQTPQTAPTLGTAPPIWTNPASGAGGTA
jgi:hypothetical protein